MDRRSNNTTSVDVEIDPHCRRLGRSQTDFALQAIVECRAAKAKCVAVLLRWHADGGGEVRRGGRRPWSDSESRGGPVDLWLSLSLFPNHKSLSESLSGSLSLSLWTL